MQPIEKPELEALIGKIPMNIKQLLRCGKLSIYDIIEILGLSVKVSTEDITELKGLVATLTEESKEPIHLSRLDEEIIKRLGDKYYITSDNKGSWSKVPEVAYKKNDISYHLGCAWICVKETTDEEPTWYADDWVYLMGDNAFSIDIDSSAGRMFRRGDVETTLSCKVMFGSFDVTQKVLSRGSVGIEWKRDTGNEVLDNAWRPYMTIPDDQTSINLRITNFDVGYDFFDRGKATFMLDMQIPTSDGYYNLTRTINIKV